MLLSVLKKSFEKMKGQMLSLKQDEAIDNNNDIFSCSGAIAKTMTFQFLF